MEDNEGHSWLQPRGGEVRTPYRFTIIWLAGVALTSFLTALLWREVFHWSWLRDGYVQAIEALLQRR